MAKVDETWAAAEAQRVSAWLHAQVEAAGALGLVLGLSGGVDSAVVAALAARALPGRVRVCIMPCHSLAADAQDARLVARHLGLEALTIDLSTAYDALLPELQAAGGQAQPLSAANVKPRLRMVALNYLAAQHHALVAGTGNASELYIGYFTKWGDSGVDLLPLGHLVKREVRALARALALPASIAAKPASAGLWEGQTDEAELGFSYDALDAYLREGPSAVPADVAGQIERLHERSSHKRRMPPMPVGGDPEPI